MSFKKAVYGLLFQLFLVIIGSNSFGQINNQLFTPPFAKNDSILIGKNQSIDIDILLNDIDLDGDINQCNIQIIANAQLGLTSLIGKKIQYAPSTNVCGFDSIKYQLTDINNEVSNISTVYIEITCFNIAPVAINDFFTLNEDQLDSMDVFDNDRYTDGPSRNISILNGPKNGSASITSIGILKYLGNDNFDGFDTLSYLFCDQDLTNPLCDTGFVFIQLNPINDPPIAEKDTLQTFSNRNKSINLKINDVDIDGPLMDYHIIQNPSQGSFILAANGLGEYQNSNSFIGTDSLQYEVCDLSSPSLCDSAWLHINISEVFEKAELKNDTLRVVFNSNNRLNILSNDNFPNTFHTDSVFILNTPSAGVFSYADSTIQFTPNTGFIGDFDLQYFIKDDIDSISNIANIKILVNELPHSIDICPIQTISNQAINIYLFQNAINGTATINQNEIIIRKLPQFGSLSPFNTADGTINYIPLNNYEGIDSFQFNLIDQDGFLSEAINVCIEIINDIPVNISSTISPNGDGLNDYLTFENIEDYPDNEVIVFDRYWNEVYHTKSYSAINYWDAQNVNTGTYYYVVKIKLNAKEKIIKGFLTLIK